MKFYFIIIILVLVVMIFLLFFILYKIYKLNAKASDELEIYEQEELLSNSSSSKGKSDDEEGSISSKESFLNSTETEGVDYLDAAPLPSKQDVSQVQPNVRELVVSRTPSPNLSRQGSMKEKPHVRFAFQYDSTKMVLKVIIKHIGSRMKARNGSSEQYVDCQVSAYRFRTYRNPGYRRPARAVIKKQIDFKLDISELRSHFFLVFLLRYDPFSRLKIDGEAIVKLTELNLDSLRSGMQLDTTKEIKKSKQDFTAFVLRPT